MSSGAEDKGVGGMTSCPSSGNGDDGRGGGGSAPDDGVEVVGISLVSLLTTKLTDNQLGGSGGAKLHRRHWRLLVSHPSSSVVVSSWWRRLRAMLLRAVFLC